VRIEEEKIDAVEFRSVDARLGSEVEHRIEIDEGFGPRAAFADKTWPHCIVERRG
jgi:hypothetical protein